MTATRARRKAEPEPELPRWIEYRPLDQINSALDNPKLHDIALLRSSVDRFGYVEPMINDDRTDRLVAGHGRHETLVESRDLGEDPPEGVLVDDDGVWWAPVVRGWSSADDAEAEAFLVAANEHPHAAGWDQDGLAAMLQRVQDQAQLGLTGTGFRPGDLSQMLTQIRPAALPTLPAPLSVPTPRAPMTVGPADDVPEVPDDARVVAAGDVWRCGSHLVMAGSCTSESDVARLYGDVVPEMVLTDPPYCSGGFQEAGRAQGSIGTVHVDGITPKIANDRLSTRGYQALLRQAVTLSRCPILYIFTDWRMWVNLFDIVESCGHGVRSMIVWNKGSPGMGRGWRSQHEIILHACSAVIEYDNRSAIGNVIDCPRTGNPLHPTQKPVDVLRQILRVTAPARTVYDPFAGAGSTLIAAEEEGRVSLNMEMDPVFCDVMLKRWTDHGGAEPEKVWPE